MARGNSSDERISIAEAAKRLGMTKQAIGQWADKAPADAVELRGGRRYLRWPAFPVWYRQRLSSTAPENFEKARARKMAAEAELTELELARVRGEQVPVDAVRKTMGQLAAKLRSQLLAVPGRYSARIVGIASLPEAQRALDLAMRDVLNELKEG